MIANSISRLYIVYPRHIDCASNSVINSLSNDNVLLLIIYLFVTICLYFLCMEIWSAWLFPLRGNPNVSIDKILGETPMKQ